MTKRQQLVEDNIDLVWKLLHTYYPSYVKDEDIVQSGMLGLCEAAAIWDESKGIAFSTLAWKCIRTKILDEFKRRDKHNGVWSLDYKYDVDGDKVALSELVPGKTDVGYVDLAFDRSQLNKTENAICDLLLDLVEPIEIARRVGCSKQLVYMTRRKMRMLRG